MHPEPMPVPQEDESIETDKSAPEIQQLCVLEIIDKLENEPAFQSSDSGVYISSNNDYDFDKIKNEIVNFSVTPRIAESIVNILGNNKGKYLADLCGFTPSSISGGSGIIKIDLLFGKIYIPSIPEFTLTISVTNSETKKGDIKIKLFGVGAGGSKEYVCKVTQTQKIKSIPVNLVIPVTYQVTKWENKEGAYFFTYEVLNLSRQIVAKEAENPYEGQDGFDTLSIMSGDVDHYNTLASFEPMEASEELSENTKITLSSKLSPSENYPIINISGEATVKKQFKVMYSIPTGYEYVTFVAKENNFQHLWAYKN